MEAIATSSGLSIARVSTRSPALAPKASVQSFFGPAVKVPSAATFRADSKTQRRIRPVCVVASEEGVGVEAAVPAVAVAGTKLYVGNLPFSVDSQSLAELFEEAGVVEMVEVVYDRDTGRSRGFGFVTMQAPEDAQAAIERFDGSDLGGRTLKVNFPTPRGERPAPSERPARGPRRNNSANKLFVGNLSWGMDDLALEDLFSEFGKVLEAKVVTDRDTGRSRGFGFVTYASGNEMEEALANLNGAEVDGRQIRVTPADKPRD